MNTDTKEQVIGLLKAYKENQVKMDVLSYELNHPAHVSPEEQTEAMIYGHGDGDGTERPSGHISDKTLYIALNYQEKTDALNNAVREEIAVQLVKLEQEQKRLTHYVSLLKSRQAEVIELLYFKGLTQKMVEKELGCSAKTVRKLRDDAVAMLFKMYECAAINR